VESLNLDNFASNTKKFIEQKIEEDVITTEDVNKRVAIQKSVTAGFIIYQLSNDFISHGVGCGIYDMSGVNDGGEIKRIMNDYLFDICFNPTISTNNAEYFIDYLLRNFASIFGSQKGRDYIPNINEFTKILDKDRLADFWKTHGDTIKTLNLQDKEKTVHVGNYSALYKDDVEPIFKILDDHLAEVVDSRNQNQTQEETE
jgi:hypothetical protein